MPGQAGFFEWDRARFAAMRRFAEQSDTEREYYCSMLDGRQKGRIFADDPDCPSAALFWHYAGFGFVAGEPDADFLEQVTAMIRQEHPCFVQDTALSRRFILQQDDPSAGHLLGNAPGIVRSERLCFALRDRGAPKPALPAGYRAQAADAGVLMRLRGDVTPLFSWSSYDAFLQSGTACCVMRGDEPAAWAFSAAIGAGRMDIGVETAPPYRGKGLGRAAACMMAETACRMGLAPVWGCDVTNEASARTAQSAGFVLYGRHAKYKKGNQPRAD